LEVRLQVAFSNRNGELGLILIGKAQDLAAVSGCSNPHSFNGNILSGALLEVTNAIEIGFGSRSSPVSHRGIALGLVWTAARITPPTERNLPKKRTKKYDLERRR
jgi:hypothetical protein